MSSNINLTILFLGVIQLLLLSDADARENIALQGIAKQKSSYIIKHNGQDYFASAWRANDNITHVPGLPEEGCTSTGNRNDTNAWWQIDLRAIYVIDSITVHNRWGAYHRLRDFYIRVGNESDISRQVFCAYKNGWIESGASETFRCVHTLIGRWVSIQRTNDKGNGDQGGQGWLQLCEVQIYGYENKECGHRRYGSDCSRICHCANNQDCDKKTRKCPPGGCDLKYGGSSCSIELPVLYWRIENTAVVSRNSVELFFYQFKKGYRRNLDTGDGPVGQYTVEFQEEGPTQWIIKDTLKHDDRKDVLNITIKGLKYNTHYNIKVVPWYQKDDDQLRGRAENVFQIKTPCGNPKQPIIANITAKEVTEEVHVTVRFKLTKDGHNCARYHKVDVNWRVVYIPSTGWSSYDWFLIEEQRVDLTIQTKHDKSARIYVENL